MQNFAYDVVNPGARQGILFLHGFLGDREEFRSVGHDFEKSRTVVYVDLPGHGESRIDTNANWHGIAKGLAQLMQAQSPKQWHVVGYSLGGRLALYLACVWPHLVRRLTLISASPGLEIERERRARWYADKMLGRRLLHSSMRSFLSYWYKQLLFKEIRSHSHFQLMMQRRLRNEAQQIQLALLAMSTGTQPSLWTKLSTLKMPVLLICGSRDQKFLRIAQDMAQRNPQFQFRVVAQAGHVVHLEAPKVVKERIADAENRMEKC